jgi:hypothetical protein
MKDLLLEFIFRVSDVIVYVVNDITRQDQLFLRKLQDHAESEENYSFPQRKK